MYLDQGFPKWAISTVDTQQQIKDNFNLYSNSSNHHKQKIITYKVNYTKLIKILIIKAD